MVENNLAFYIAVALAMILTYWILSGKRKERTRAVHLGRENIFRQEEDALRPERVKEMWFIPQRVRTEKPSAITTALTMMRKPARRAGKQAPVRGACAFCGKQVTMPFKCKFCGGLHCDGHRLPESHKCVGLGKLRREQKRSSA